MKADRRTFPARSSVAPLLARGARFALGPGGVVQYSAGDSPGQHGLDGNSSGSKVAELRYKAWGETRYTWGTTPTTYRYTGQRQEGSLGLYQMGARWVDPALARWLSADTLVPEAGNPQALNRYAYVTNNPLKYTDPSGHCPLCVAVGIVILKAVDWGWTAWDTYQSGRVLADPNATDEDKLLAGFNVALAGLELAEPDDLLPVGLPVDDVARKGILAGFREAIQQGGLKTGVRFVRDSLGDAAPGVIRHMYDQGMFRGIKSAGEWADIFGSGLRQEAGLEVHHLIEQRFAQKLGLDPASIPSIVLTREEHQAFTSAWRNAIGYDNMGSAIRTSTATLEDVWMAAQSVYRDYPELLDAVRRALGK